MGEILQSVVQLFIISLIPFIVWIFRKDKSISFFKSLGLYKPQISNPKKLVLSSGLVIILFLVSGVSITGSITSRDVELANSQFIGTGVSQIIPILFYAFLKTGLTEEILFRGFLGKKAIAKFGFTVGNSIQSIIFGLIHGIPILLVLGVGYALVLFAFTFIVAWTMGVINEKYAGGSIVPSWIIHGIVNTISSLLMAF